MSAETAHNQVAKDFIAFYYSAFDRSRQELTPLYREHSMLSFEGQSFSGIQAVIGKLTVHRLN